MKLWKFLLLCAVFILCGGVLTLGVNFLVLPSLVHSNKAVAMPDLRGLTAEQAAERLRPLGLEVEVSRSRPHPTVDQDLILDQIPGPEAMIRGGRTVRVVTSEGPPAGTLPDLVGLSLPQAEITLQRENYRLGKVLKIQRPGVTQPIVDFQSPAAGTDLYKGAVVDLVVAEPGAALLLRMPDLRGLPLPRATRIVTDAGFVLDPVRYRRTDEVAPNHVVAQTPAPGARVSKGERLELVASSR
jgi:serine/threonine-protein kinase